MPTSTSKRLFKVATFKKVALTTGDPNGIGFEVTVKALISLSKTKQAIPLFILFRDSKQAEAQPKLFKKLDAKWKRITFFSLEMALQFAKSLTAKSLQKNKILIDLSLRTSAADWVFEATRACIKSELDSIVTAPLSKTLIRKSGYSEIGHTGIFRSFFPEISMHMGFVGSDFSVLLATDHIPLREVEPSVTVKNLQSAYRSALLLKKALNSKKVIAVLGVNPHAGEEGLIGLTEKKLLKNIPTGFEGPLVPDAAFLRKNWSRYSLFLCMYHDQGLIPFKMQHGQDSGVHVTMGLPFVRTSVDHGTAFDIYNKNLANPTSMLDAIKFNLKLMKES